MKNDFPVFLLNYIADKNPLHLKKLRKNLRRMEADPEFESLSSEFYDRYDAFLQRTGKTRAYAAGCYLRMIDDFLAETVRFQETGKYSSSSFAEVEARVYAEPAVMEYYMHGLLLTQFLWQHHYAVLKYFKKRLPAFAENTARYLEIGAGHGLYLNEALRSLGTAIDYCVVDISATSLDMARNFTDSERVRFVHADVFDFRDGDGFDFITMGEVLEHVEDPVALLARLHDLLNDGGRLFLTTPTNAPAIDHIHLFRNAEEVRAVIGQAGWSVQEEAHFYAEELPAGLAEELKVPMIYAAVLRKK